MKGSNPSQYIYAFIKNPWGAKSSIKSRLTALKERDKASKGERTNPKIILLIIANSQESSSLYIKECMYMYI